MTSLKQTPRSAIRRTLLPGILLGFAAASLPAEAATTTPATWYSSGPVGTTAQDGSTTWQTDKTTAGGSGQYQQVLTYFDSVSLDHVGESVNISLQFSGEAGVHQNSTAALNFAFYNSDDSRIDQNNLGQNSPMFNAYRGYRVGMRTSTGGSSPVPPEPFMLRARTGYNNALGAANSDIAPGGPESSKAYLFASSYSVSYTITRSAVDRISVSFSITGGNFGSNYNGEWIISSYIPDPDVEGGTMVNPAFFTRFDTFAVLVFNSTSFKTVTLKDVVITTNQIPEAGEVALLLGAGALVVAAFARRKRRS